MTVFAALNLIGIPSILSDLMVIGPRGGGIGVGLPTTHNNEMLPYEAVHSIVGGTRKSIIIGQNTCAVAAGNTASVIRFPTFVNDQIRGPINSRDELYDVISAYEGAVDASDIDYVVISTSSEGTAFAFRTAQPQITTGAIQAVVGGSGAGQWATYLKQGPGVVYDAPSQLASYGLATIAHAFVSQLYNGVGVRDGWGGAFELVISDGRRLEYFGNFATVIWECRELHPGQLTARPRRGFFYQWYVGDWLMITFDGHREGQRTMYAYAPALGTTEMPPFELPEIRPKALLYGLYRNHRDGRPRFYGQAQILNDGQWDDDEWIDAHTLQVMRLFIENDEELRMVSADPWED